MKKTITLLLTLCLLLGLLPTEAVAFAGDIYRAGEVKTVKMADGSLSLQNGYVHVTLHKLFETYSYLTVVPTAKPDEDSMWNSQTPYCNYTTYNQGVSALKKRYGQRHHQRHNELHLQPRQRLHESTNRDIPVETVRGEVIVIYVKRTPLTAKSGQGSPFQSIERVF